MTQNPRPGRPRSSIDGEVFAATLRTVHELGYTRATVDRIAAEAGVAKTTIYRRWSSKGALIAAAVADAFGSIPERDGDLDAFFAAGVHWVAGKIASPGVGAALAGVFTDAVGDAELREVLYATLQRPFLEPLAERLGESQRKVRFIMDATVGTLLQRIGMTGEPMDDEDVELLVKMVRGVLG